MHLCHTHPRVLCARHICTNSCVAHAICAATLVSDLMPQCVPKISQELIRRSEDHTPDKTGDRALPVEGEGREALMSLRESLELGVGKGGPVERVESGGSVRHPRMRWRIMRDRVCCLLVCALCTDMLLVCCFELCDVWY